MRKRRWLLITTVALMALMGGFALVMRSGMADEYIRGRIEQELTKALQGEVRVGQLSANDRSAYAFDVSAQLPDGLGSVYVRRLYVRYNLWRFLFTGLNFRGVIENITIEEPEAHLSFQPVAGEKAPPTADAGESKPFALPDLGGYFRHVELKDGVISVIAGDSLVGVAQSVRNLNIVIDNTSQTQATVHAAIGEGTLEAEGAIAGGEVLQAVAHLRNIRPDGVNLAMLDAFDLALNADIVMQGDSIGFSGAVSGVRIDVADRQVRGGLAFRGDMDQVRVDTDSLRVDNQIVRIHSALRKPFDAERPLDGELRAVVDLKKYTSDVDGRVRVRVDLGGTVGAPRVRAEVESDSLVAGGEKLANVQAKGSWRNGQAEFTLTNAEWRGNTIYGKGTLNQRGAVDAFIDCDTLRYSSGDLAVSGYTRARLQIERGSVRAEAEIMNIALQAGPLRLRGLEARARYGRDQVRLDMHDADKRLIVNVQASLVDTTGALIVDFRRYPLNVALPGSGGRLPSISGKMTVNGSMRNVQLVSSLRVFDSKFGLLDGFIETNAAVDFLHNRSFISVSTRHGVYNYEPFEVKLLAAGTIDSIATRDFSINDEIDLRVWASLKPKFDWGFDITAPRVHIARYLAYVMGANAARQYGGAIDMELVYNRRGNGKALARVRTDDLKIGDIEGLALDLSMAGPPERLAIDRSRILNNGKTVCSLSGTVNVLQGEFRVSLINRNLKLDEVFPDSKMKGELRMQCQAFRHATVGMGVDAEINGLNCVFFGFEADTLEVELTQRERELRVRKFYSMNTRQYWLNADGAIAYNLLTNRAYSDSLSMHVQFFGDPFRAMSNALPSLEHGRGSANVDMRISVQDERLSVDHATIEVKEGRIVIVGQPNRLEEMKVKIDVERNVMRIDRCQVKMGEGMLYVSNDHDERTKSIMVGNLNVGCLSVRTDDKGVLAHVPQYTPENSVASIRITGRDAPALRVTGPIDSLYIIGDVHLSNGEAIFPPNVETLMDFVYGRPKPVKDQPEEVQLPLRFDVRIEVGEQIHYVTRPADFLMKPGSFLHLVYDGEQFVVPEAQFVSESGTAEAFGTVFQVERLQIDINQFNPMPSITGALYRKTADGTLITLRVTPAGADAPGTWKLELDSDDPNDTTIVDILAKLRYNRSRDELTPQQKQSLLQDEALDMAGVEIESALLDPLISPFENYLRRMLRLDSFTMRPSVVRNLFSEYAGTDDPATEEIDREKDDTLQTSAGLLLNNLSINLGKYVVRNVYLDYELLVQETTDIESMNMKLNHTFTLRYDLPLRFKLSLKYIVDTEAEEQNHEIMIERSFRF